MFYNNRKTIYILLIIFAIILSFLCGKKVGSGVVITKQTSETILENLHYNDTLSVKGNDYSIDYSIINALFLDESSMQFNVTMQNNKNVNTIRVVAKDQDNNILNIESNISDDKKFLKYNVKLDSNTTAISIYIYPLTKIMSANTNLNLDSIPFKTSKLYVKLLKQQQIRKLQN